MNLKQSAPVESTWKGEPLPRVEYVDYFALAYLARIQNPTLLPAMSEAQWKDAHNDDRYAEIVKVRAEVMRAIDASLLAQRVSAMFEDFALERGYIDPRNV